LEVCVRTRGAGTDVAQLGAIIIIFLSMGPELSCDSMPIDMRLSGFTIDVDFGHFIY